MSLAQRVMKSTMFIAVVLIVIPAVAQNRRTTGQRPWVVVKSSLSDFTARGDEEVADFDSEPDAKAEASRLNDSTPNSDVGKYVYLTHKRLAGETGESGNVIDQSGLSPKPRRPATPGLTQGSTKKAIVVRVYKLNNGTWAGVSDLTYSTTSDYDRASKYFQEYKTKNGFTATWNAPGWPRPSVQKPEMKTIDVGGSIAGTSWVQQNSGSTSLNGATWEFRKNGSLTWTQPSGKSLEIQWRQNGNTIVAEFPGKPTTGTIKGDEIVFESGLRVVRKR
jgi:hypothetical protein